MKLIPAIRAPAAPGRSRIYEKIIRETLRAEACESVAELVAAVKARCARARVPYQHHEIDDALAAMGDSVTRELRTPRPAMPPVRAEAAPLNQAEAIAALADLRAKLGPLPALKPMATVHVLTPRQDDKRRALAVVMQAIQAQIAAGEALEQQGPAEDSAAATTGARTAGECAPSPAPSPDAERTR
jgi:hypothetical protein